MVEAYARAARARGYEAITVITTNHNADSLRFYQSHGFVLRDVRIGAMDAARALKPELPLTGAHGLPIRDEIELVHPLV